MFELKLHILKGTDRVAIFFQVMAANITTQFLGSLASAVLMVFGTWTPMLLGLLIEFLSIICLLFLSETLGYDDSISTEQTFLSSAEEAQRESPRWRKLLRSARSSISLLTRDIRVLCLALVFVVHMLFLNRDILLQYISTRYDIPLARATLFISVRSGLILFLCVLILPALNHYLRNLLGSKRSDLVLGRVSALIIAISFLAVAMASTQALLVTALVCNSFGWGMFSFVRSLAVSLVHESGVARLNSLIGVFDTFGMMVGSPLLAALFSKGLEVQGLLFGLPFLFCSGAVTLIALGLMWITI